ncbi:MAG: hypothetical protein GY782_04995 [Gammaproteobacteria bacterium]|nr:hypothetical protein [Gammaproteobacteria bacterium]
MTDTAATLTGKKRFLTLALIGYLLIAYLYFGISVLGYSGRLTGAGADPVGNLWYLHWWGYALHHHLNPFISHVVWAPSGYNLAKSVSILGIYLLTLPLQLVTTKLTAYNIIVIFAPGLAAWTMLLLTLDLTRQRLPALVAGYLFGFSAYMIGQIVAHANLTTGVFLLPLVVWLTILHMRATIRSATFILGSTLCLMLLFLISKEMLVTFSLCGAIAFIIALLILPKLHYQRCKHTIVALSIAHVMMIILLSPILYYFFSDTINGHYANNPAIYANDLLSFIIPTTFMQFITTGNAKLSSHFNATYVEQGAYLGLPLLIILGQFFYCHWRKPAVRYCLCLLLIYAFISLGPILSIAGNKKIMLYPNHFFFSLPFIQYSLAQRYALYTSFIVAVTVALWLANNQGKLMCRLKYPLLLLVILSLLPCIKSTALHPANRHFYTHINQLPDFFSKKLYQKWLPHGDAILILPFAAKVYKAEQGYIVKADTLCQLHSNFYFNLAGGYLGIIPRAYQQPIVTSALGQHNPAATNSSALKQFIEEKNINAIIALPKQYATWHYLIDQLGIKPIKVGDVYLYRLSNSRRVRH